mmetsp:Transcript_19446/g.42547  ORF Transcript_19446/g.42547 Transcript_19446/m.42547 type:complete len:216 (-) Transcript_19446:37-684(-)|eukprot:CAMPEP_0118946702 /NCGR_PEP_ID=MMETSP1169-20130426/44685_1 /TAXON_ID=36882 /ORGANISM="Pyramimonas obovata, Strain CCMP722" /LENGTH=215 /DNA_ID=CAMNT_0006892739 /DNA_START=197 /DNA_END=844 /DNA_ORIENTATION=+
MCIAQTTPSTTTSALEMPWEPSSQRNAVVPAAVQGDARKTTVKPKWTLGFLPPVHLRLPDYDYSDLNEPSTRPQEDDILLSEPEEEPSDDTIQYRLSSDLSPTLKRSLSSATVRMHHQPPARPASTSLPTVHYATTSQKEVCDQQPNLFAALHNDIQAYCLLHQKQRTQPRLFQDISLNLSSRCNTPSLFSPISLSDQQPLGASTKRFRVSLESQ